MTEDSFGLQEQFHIFLWKLLGISGFGMVRGPRSDPQIDVASPPLPGYTGASHGFNVSLFLNTPNWRVTSSAGGRKQWFFNICNTNNTGGWSCLREGVLTFSSLLAWISQCARIDLFGLVNSLMGRICLVHCRLFSSIPEFYVLDVTSNTPLLNHGNKKYLQVLCTLGLQESGI